jgi:DNA primase
LYGFDLAKTAIKRAGFAILVEGNMDCIASHQVGVNNWVAVSGTALTKEQVGLLKRVTNRVVFSFDEDTAGVQAALRALDHALQAAMDIAIVKLPFGKDPDEVIRKDQAAWPKAVAEAQPVMEYFFNSATVGKDMKQIAAKKSATRELLPIVAKLGDPVEQSHYLQQLADLVKVEKDVLQGMLPVRAKAETVTATPTAKPAVKAVPPADRYRSASERMLALLIAYPAMLSQATDRVDPTQLVGDDLRGLYKTFLVWYSQHHFTTRQELDEQTAALKAEEQPLYVLLSLLADKEFSTAFDPLREEEFLSLAGALKRHALSQDLHQIEAEIGRLERRGAAEDPEMGRLLDRVRELTEQLRSLG